MRGAYRFGLLAAIVLLASVVLFGCGGGDDQSAAGASTTVKGGQGAATTQSPATASSETTEAITPTSGGAAAETGVSGMPAEFPADVPVHPGTVTAYNPMKVTDTTTVHQLTVQTTASFDDVIAWYKSQLPSGWSVGYLEAEDGQGWIALNGGSYAPANPDRKGGGVLVGVSTGDKTEIVVTVTVMGK
jgi:hypothetical protein